MNNLFNNKKIEFPVSYTLKVFMEMEKGHNFNQSQIINILKKLNINHSEISNRLSKENRYVSYSIDVEIENELIFKLLYKELKENPHIKYAI